MASSAVADAGLTIDPPEDTKEIAETLTEFESNSDAINVEDETEDLSAADRFQQRLDRFGKIAPEAKKISRALRFGTSHEAVDGAAKKRRLDRFGVVPHSAEEEQEKKRTRSERFHATNPTSAIDEETKQKRVNRFGVVTPSTPSSKNNKVDGKSAPTTPVSSDTIKKRTERFGDVSQVAKANTMTEQKAKRADRFKPITSV